MTNEELEQILSAGTVDERIIDLLREQLTAEEQSAAIGDRPTGEMVGNVYVPNIAGPIAGIFERRMLGKKIKAAKSDRAKAQAERDAISRTMAEGVLGRNLEPIQPSVPRIGAPPAVDTAAQEAILARPGPKPVVPQQAAPQAAPAAPMGGAGAGPMPIPAPPGMPQPAPGGGPDILEDFPSNGPVDVVALIEALQRQLKAGAL